ncbi:MAG: hypothetical protein JW715_02165 [Sedimentisphaerales bacterium]|nr:hypothetical protein [Sedimentisphaerales bacterium]
MEMNRYVSGLVMALNGLCLIVVGGCSPGVRPEKMVPDSLDVTTLHAESISVNVMGQAPLSFLNAFDKATTQCIENFYVFELGQPDAASNLVLDIIVMRLESPASIYAWPEGMEWYQAYKGAAVCTLVTIWRLSKADRESILAEEEIVTSNTHNVPDYMTGGLHTAGRDATEAAVRDNIKKGLEWLAGVQW